MYSEVIIEDWDLLKKSINIFGAYLQTLYQNKTSNKKYTSFFMENGYALIPLPEKVVTELMLFFAPALQIPFDINDVSPSSLKGTQKKEKIISLEKQILFYSAPSEITQKSFVKFMKLIAPVVEQQIGSHFKITNVRAWNTKPNTNFGPYNWHFDGGSVFIRKLMFYLRPPNLENGSIEISDRTGHSFVVKHSSPVCVLYDSSVLSHRGIAPSNIDLRPVIEVTLSPSEATHIDFIYAGQNAKMSALAPEHIAFELTRKRYSNLNIKDSNVEYFPPPVPGANLLRALNIGGGPKFNHGEWINLEGVASEHNLFPFIFSKDCIFPLPSSIMQLVYSSHCLEHLDDPTVDQVLSEAKRVMRTDGELLLKLPDFIFIKRALETKNTLFFKQWGIEKLIPLWKSHGVEDNLTNRAAYWFCGFWNKAYGDHFSREISFDESAYNGPPKLAEINLHAMIMNSSPHSTSTQLSDLVRSTENDYIFNHQNAWDESELEELLSRHGFIVKSFDKEKICKFYSGVPDILFMKDISIYCLASLQK